MIETFVLGVFAAVLQVAGYIAYGFKVLRHDIAPNPASWLMFAYGTTLLVVVEWDRGASFALLALPASCALLSIGVAIYALRSAQWWWPRHYLERFSFILDVALTILYVSAWILLSRGIITATSKELTEIVILVCWNIGIFTSFFPLLRQVYREPASEHASPWILWAFAYLTLAVVTFAEEGGFNELMLYPLINIVIHAFIALHTARWHYRYHYSRP